MKFDALNAFLTFVLGVLVVAGVVLALNVAFVSHETRVMQQTAIVSKVNLERAQGVFAEAKAYYQKNPSPELDRILKSVPTKPSTPRHTHE